VPSSLSKKEERRWARLHLAIPVFVRSRDASDQDSLEFATALKSLLGVRWSPFVILCRIRPWFDRDSECSHRARSGIEELFPRHSRQGCVGRHFDAYHLLA